MSQDVMAGGAAAPSHGSAMSFIRTHLREYGILIALVVIVAFFQIATGGILLTPVNLTNIILQNSYIIIMALGMLLVIVSGHIDLSVGSVLGFVGAIAGAMIVTWDWNPILASICCLAVGFVIGGIQGFFVAYMKIPSFIVTLAGLLIFKGATLLFLAGASVGPFPAEFNLLSSGFIPDLLSGVSQTIIDTFALRRFNSFTFLVGFVLAAALFATSIRSRMAHKGAVEEEPAAFFWARIVIVCGAILYFSWLMANFRGLPNVLIIMALLIAIYSFVTTRTTIGRRIYAIGGNAKAAKLSGINTERLVFLTFANMGLLAALAGLVFTARLNVAQPKAGQGFELDVIAAVFIGGASMAGGFGTVIGAVAGAFIMGVLNNGMGILGVGIDYQQMIKGLVLLAAVIFDVLNRRNAS